MLAYAAVGAQRGSAVAARNYSAQLTPLAARLSATPRARHVQPLCAPCVRSRCLRWGGGDCAWRRNLSSPQDTQ